MAKAGLKALQSIFFLQTEKHEKGSSSSSKAIPEKPVVVEKKGKDKTVG